MGLRLIEKALAATKFDDSKRPGFGCERDQHGRADQAEEGKAGQKPLSGSQPLELEIGEYRAWSRWGVCGGLHEDSVGKEKARERVLRA